MPLLTWSSFPVLVLAGLALWEALPCLHPSWRNARWWYGTAWFARPWGVWASLNIVYRYLAAWGVGDRTSYPFYFEPWRSGIRWNAMLAWLASCRGLAMWSLILLLLALLFLFTCRRIVAAPPSRRMTTLMLVVLVAFAFVLPLVYECLPEGPADMRDSSGSFLRAWLDSGSTMLYCMPRVTTKSHYLKHFQEIQPTLGASIHGVTHPPGASLALYWMGKLFGATGHIATDRVRYALGSTLFAAMGVAAVFFLGWTLYGSRQIGLISAALWTVKPAALAYNTFAPDAVYTVFFILCLALSWRVATADRPLWGSMAGLGIALYALAMVNFIWPLVAALFGLMVLIFAHRLRLRPTDWLVRGVVPLGLTVALLITTCVQYRLDYMAIFHYAMTCYADYHKPGVYVRAMEIIGGQVDLYLLTGSFCAYIFWTRFPGWVRRKPLPPQALFFLVILAFQLLPILFLNGPAGEASRIWAWIPAVPVVVTASYLCAMDRPRFLVPMAAGFALFQYYGMRLFLMALG